MLIPANYLKAAALLSAKNDIRQYLNGVYVTGNHLVATDGTVAVVLRLAETSPDSYIIPNEVLKRVKLFSTMSINVTATQIADITYTPQEGKFPDYMRIVPRGKMSGEVAHFDFDKLTMFKKAIALITGQKNPFVCLEHNGPSGARVTCSSPDFVGVVMPFRATASFTAPSLDWLL